MGIDIKLAHEIKKKRKKKFQRNFRWPMGMRHASVLFGTAVLLPMSMSVLSARAQRRAWYSSRLRHDGCSCQRALLGMLLESTLYVSQ